MSDRRTDGPPKLCARARLELSKEQQICFVFLFYFYANENNQNRQTEFIMSAAAAVDGRVVSKVAPILASLP